MITIFLPTLDEEGAIAAVMRGIPFDEIRSRDHDIEVLVVDGHSTDRTRDIAEEEGARIVLQNGRGKGLAVRTAIDCFKGDYLFMMDGDNTYPPGYIYPMLDMLEHENYDIIMGSRLKGYIQSGAMTRFNRLGNHILTRLGNLLFPNGHELTDICTGMWGFKRHVIKSLELTSTGFEIEAEMFSKAVKMGYKIGELPIEYRKRVAPPKLRSVYDGMRIGLRLVGEKVL